MAPSRRRSGPFIPKPRAVARRVAAAPGRSTKIQGNRLQAGTRLLRPADFHGWCLMLRRGLAGGCHHVSLRGPCGGTGQGKRMRRHTARFVQGLGASSRPCLHGPFPERLLRCCLLHPHRASGPTCLRRLAAGAMILDGQLVVDREAAGVNANHAAGDSASKRKWTSWSQRLACAAGPGSRASKTHCISGKLQQDPGGIADEVSWPNCPAGRS